MKNLLLFIFLIVIVTSCHHHYKELNQQLALADSLAINYFKGDGKMDTVVSVKIIKDKNTIQQLAELITASSSEEIKNCGLDGSIHFFKNDRVIKDADFRMYNDQCMHFALKDEKGKAITTELTSAAKQLLEGLKK